MPTLRTASTNISAAATGDCTVTQDRNGTVITYTGVLTLNGQRVLSPDQMRARWADLCQRALNVTDRHTDEASVEHLTARGECVGYATAIELLDKIPSLADLPAALAAVRGELAKQVLPEITAAQHKGIDVGLSVVDRCAADVKVTCQYEWGGARETVQGDVTVVQVIDTVEPGSTVVGYIADAL